MNPNHPSFTDRERIRARLDRPLTELLLERARSGWTTPALEAVAGAFRRIDGPQCQLRLFDMEGEIDVPMNESELRPLFDEFQGVCAAGGDDWSRCLVTMLIAPDRKSFQVQWNFKYS